MPAIVSFYGWDRQPHSPPLPGPFVVGQSKDQEVSVCLHSAFQPVDKLTMAKARLPFKAR